MQKELDLTTASMAQENYERIKRKSLQDSNNLKKQKVYGEVYRGKKVTKKKMHTVVALAISTVAIIVSAKGMHHYEVTDTYKRELKMAASNELSYSETEDLLKNYDKPAEHYERALEEYNILPDDYDFFGNRLDKNEKDNKADADTFYSLNDKWQEAVENAVTEELEEYKEAVR